MTKRGSGFEIAAWELWDVYSGFGSAVCSAAICQLLKLGNSSYPRENDQERPR